MVARGHVEYFFECSARYLTSECSERARYKHENSLDIPYLQATMYYDNDVLTIFRRFPTTFQRFPKIPLKLLEGHTKVAEHFSIISEAIPEDFRERPEDVRFKNEALEPTGS